MQDVPRTTTPRRWWPHAGIAVALLLLLVAAPVNARSEADERAAKRVEAIANFLAKAPRLSVTADCSYDVVQDSGQKIEFGELRVITLRRPDRAHIDTTRRDGGRRGLIFDGKQIAAFDLDQKVYATIQKPGTTDAAFDYIKLMTFREEPASRYLNRTSGRLREYLTYRPCRRTTTEWKVRGQCQFRRPSSRPSA